MAAREELHSGWCLGLGGFESLPCHSPGCENFLGKIVRVKGSQTGVPVRISFAYVKHIK